MTTKVEPGSRCPSCTRPVKAGMTCLSTTCPFELKIRDGIVVLASPPRLRWVF